MPIAHADLVEESPSPAPLPSQLPFPPITKFHILNCSYHSWYPRYRDITPKTRLVPLPPPFLSYLRADGIRLPSEDNAAEDSWDDDSSVEDDEDTSMTSDPSLLWQDVHTKIKALIAELDGSVMPKLNWSAPKDGNWIAGSSSMECRTANDIYLLLKSSHFITHDLEQVFIDCEDDSNSEDNNDQEPLNDDDCRPLEDMPSKSKSLSAIPYHLVLRKTVRNFNTSLEFRCFVRDRNLLCMCQRDLRHYSFLPPLIPKFRCLIQNFYDKNLKRSFPDDSFAFDVYIPPPHDRVWLIDINPWAPRTDPLLFSWLEILNMKRQSQEDLFDDAQNGFVRISLNGQGLVSNGQNRHLEKADHELQVDDDDDVAEDTDEGSASEEDIFTPEFRLVNRDGSEAYSFNRPQYSTHKLPKDIVDTSADGEAGLKEFLGTRREIFAK